MKKKILTEYDQMRKMLKTIHQIKEQTDPQYQNRLNNSEQSHTAEDNKQQFNVDGDYIVIHSSNPQIELTEEIRNVFQTTKDEFSQQVTEMVELNPCQLYDKDVEWSGKLTKFHLEFFYFLGEKHNGVYIKGDMIKVDDDEFTTVMGQLNDYYKAFTQKWSPILTHHNENPQ